STLDIWQIRKNELCEDVMRRLEPALQPSELSGPLISILVPVFNTPLQFLDRMISSVLNQSYQNWELCLVDDASTESAVTMSLRHHAGRDRRIKVRLSERNGGISATTNIAVE